MGNKWKTCSWGEILSLEYGKGIRTYSKEHGKYQVFGSNGPIGWTDKYLSAGPGVILGRKGAYRGVEFSRHPFFVIDTAYYIKPLINLNMRWLYYAIIYHKLGEIDDGSPIPSTTRAAVYIKQLQLPPAKEQAAIAAVLGGFDDKIELNLRINKTLESMARALFKSWFVDFDPVIDNALTAGKPVPEELQSRAALREAMADDRKALPDDVRKRFPNELVRTMEMGWIPKGWETQPLYNIAQFINGAAYRSFHFTNESGALPVVKIAEIKNGISGQTKFTKSQMPDKYKIDDGEILFSWSGNPDTSIDTFVWTGGPGWLNQHIFKVELYSQETRFTTYYQLKHLRPLFAEIARNKQTTGLGHVTAQDMKRIFTIKAKPDIIAAFNKTIGPLYNKWYSTLLFIRELKELRDYLLPKLISGELRVPDAEKIIARA